MPRIDRSLLGTDIIRFYQNNLNPEQKEVVDEFFGIRLEDDDPFREEREDFRNLIARVRASTTNIRRAITLLDFLEDPIDIAQGALIELDDFFQGLFD